MQAQLDCKASVGQRDGCNASDEWSLTFDAVSDLVAILDNNYRIVRINRAMTVRFADTGCGITPEDQRRIFEARFTTKTNGIGIGLPVVRQLLHGMGGRIALESRSERGTVFVVSRPLLG